MLDEALDQPQVYKLCDEAVLMLNLVNETFTLIQRTKNIDPVKKLMEVHDILATNVSVLQKFKGMTFDEVWLDISTIRYINRLRCELFVYHRKDFINPKEFDTYNRNLSRFINLIILRLKNGFEMTELEMVII